MSIGKMRHQVELQQVVKTRDDHGGAGRAYVAYATGVWAGIMYVSGTEKETGQQVSGETSHKIKIRYDSRVVNTDRVKFGDRIFEINSVNNPGEQNRWLVLYCREVSK